MLPIYYAAVIAVTMPARAYSNVSAGSNPVVDASRLVTQHPVVTEKIINVTVWIVAKIAEQIRRD